MGMHRIDNSTLGCTLSHMAALRSLAESDSDMAAIFEDDAQLDPDLPNVLDALQTGQANTEPYLFDVVLLQGPGSQAVVPTLRFVAHLQSRQSKVSCEALAKRRL